MLGRGLCPSSVALIREPIMFVVGLMFTEMLGWDDVEDAAWFRQLRLAGIRNQFPARLRPASGC